MSLTVNLAPEALEQIAQRAAEILREQLPSEATSPYRTVAEAAEYLRCSKQSIYDRVHQGALAPSRDGKRLLFHRDALDAYLAGRVSA